MRDDNKKSGEPACPVPLSDYTHVLMAHGGGGKLMHRLIDTIFCREFDNQLLKNKHDGAVFDIPAGRMAFTTDSYVIDPLFFPGGDIGSLSIYGTVNDLAMCGAEPLHLSAGFIIEEGLPTATLRDIAQSMRRAADTAGVQIVTGDTKVVEKGRGHGVFINTAGVGIIRHDLNIAPTEIKPGDGIILNGDIGRHGIAVMAKREGLSFETEIESDCAPLADTVLRLIETGIEIHCLRDLTRGGLATSLVEIAQTAGKNIRIDENIIPVHPAVQAACEILGFEPVYIANEGRFVAFVPGKDIDRALKTLTDKKLWPDSKVIGRVTDEKGGLVTMKTLLGTERIVDMPSGEQLPRIC